MITQINFRSKWLATEDTHIWIDSNSTNPNSTRLSIPSGTILTWDDDAPNGNVWFYVNIDGKDYRGKRECGYITNLIKSGEIELLDNGNGRTAYTNNFLQMLLK